MAVVETSWDETLRTHKSFAEPLPEQNMDLIEQAKVDVKRLRKHAILSAERKSAQVHSVPTAVLVMALAPSWRIKDNQVVKHFGVGLSREPTLRAPFTYRAMLAGYTMVNRTKLTPLKWHMSWSAALLKGNGKAGAEGMRIVHRLDEQGKSFLLASFDSPSLVLHPPSLTRHRVSFHTGGEKQEFSHSSLPFGELAELVATATFST